MNNIWSRLGKRWSATNKGNGAKKTDNTALRAQPGSGGQSASRENLPESEVEQEQLEEQAQAHISQGRLADAVRLFEELCRIDPHRVPARFQLAVTLTKLNHTEQAAQHLQQVLQQQPGHTDAWAMLADTHIRAGRMAEAKDCAGQSLAINAEHAHALLVTGIACAELGELEQADEMLTRATAKLPQDAHSLVHLARVCMRRQMPQRAETFFVRARAINPQLAPACVGHGNSLLRQARYDEAERVFAETCQRFPGNVSLFNQIGNMYRVATHLDKALTYYRMSLKLQPDLAEVHNNIATILQAQGLLEQAEKAYQKAIDLKPGFWQAHSNRIFLLNYLPGTSGHKLLDAHKTWADQHTGKLPRFTTWSNDRQTNRPLRVGYLSPDFHHHPVSAFMMPILANHNPGRVTSVCFADSLKVDDVTAKLRGLAPEWHTVKSLSDEQLSELIRRERIDILVDLAGHSGQHRLRTFACKPAPLQINYLGYPATSGLAEMDYRLTDA
ncbi:MAG TPA: tetratricopeptide repeat protein, partial [Gammaproteobacteria bacterium]|nr:tetratricopeptide repeat protein [Gammaproteobacteria bacterium]